MKDTSGEGKIVFRVYSALHIVMFHLQSQQVGQFAHIGIWYNLLSGKLSQITYRQDLVVSRLMCFDFVSFNWIRHFFVHLLSLLREIVN